MQLLHHRRLFFGNGVVLMVDVLHDERVEGFLGAEKTGECRSQRQNQALLERGAGGIRPGDAPAGVQSCDQLADSRRLARTLAVVHRPTTSPARTPARSRVTTG